MTLSFNPSSRESFVALNNSLANYDLIVETAITHEQAEILCKIAGCECQFTFGDVVNVSVFEAITEIYETLGKLEMSHPDDREPFLKAIRLFKALL